MPYPDDGPQSGSTAQQEEDLSNTEKHWNQISLGITTIATALLGATLLIAGFTEQNGNDRGTAENARALFTLVAAGIYLILLQNLGKVIFPNPLQSRGARKAHRRRWAATTFSTFTALAATTALIVLITALSGFTDQSETNGTVKEKTVDCSSTQTGIVGTLTVPPGTGKLTPVEPNGHQTWWPSRDFKPSEECRTVR